MKVDPATRNIAVTMAVSFALAVGFFVWQRRTPSASTVSLPEAPAQASGNDSNAPFGAATPRGSDSATSRPTASRPAAATAGDEAAQPVPDPNLDGPPLPVVFTIRFRDDFVFDPDGNHPPVPKRITEGFLFNDSEKNLEVTVLETNLPTMRVSKLQFTLRHGMQKSFGEKDGLPMTAGDELTLRSASYHDLTRNVP